MSLDVVSNKLSHPVLCARVSVCVCCVGHWVALLGMHGASPYHHHPGPDQRDKEREQRLQEARARPGEGRGNTATETTMRHSQQAADGSAVSTVTKTERLVHSSKAWGIEWGCVLPTPELCASHTPLLSPSFPHHPDSCRRRHPDGPHHHGGVKFCTALGE